MTVSAADIARAQSALQGIVVTTPCFHSRTLSDAVGAEVWLKFENLQFTGSFKDRGALAKLLSLSPSERQAGVIAASAGNHAQGVAYHAMRLGIPATIVMPRFTPHIKIQRTRAFGATVELHGDNYDDAFARAQTLTAERSFAFVHAYDDEAIIAGQGTVALEMLTVQPRLDAIVVPIGGGGLIAGIAIAAHHINPAIRITGVQCSRFPAMHDALKGVQPEFGFSTIAEGIAVKAPGGITLPIIRREVPEIHLVEEGDIEQAIVMLLEIEKTVVEGAGAAGLAALLKYRERYAGQRVGVVLSGGNIDPLMLASIVQRGMVRSGRLARIFVEMRDLPGNLARVTACLADAGANIEEAHHQRAFTHVPVQSVEVEFVLQTRNTAHLDEIMQAVAAAGFKARVHHD